MNDTARHRRTSKRIWRAVAAATLVVALVAARPRPAAAEFTPKDLFEVLGKIQSAFGAVALLGSIFDPQPGLADAIEIGVNEIRQQRNDRIKAMVFSLAGRHRELALNPGNYDPVRFANLVDDSFDVYAEIRQVVMRGDQASSAYDLASALNVILPLRALAMNNQNAMAAQRGLPAPHALAAVGLWLDDSTNTNYVLNGAHQVVCAGWAGEAWLNTSGPAGNIRAYQKQLWLGKFANYNFQGGWRFSCGPRGSCGQVPVMCNVANWSCNFPLWNLNAVLQAESDKISTRMWNDPVMTIIRAGLQGAYNTGHATVTEPNCGPGFGDGVGVIHTI